jgi:hypothetical protein
MKTLFLAAVVLTLAACANAPSSTSTSRSTSWWDYRQQVMQERDRGDLSPVAAEEKIAAKYREIYGPDPTMEGVFAYGERLYVMAEAGSLSIGEADALASARVDEILARDAAEVKYHAWLESRFPPNGGD